MTADDLAPLEQTLADLLAGFRKQAGLSQRQVGKRIDYSRSTVAGAEARTRVPAEAFWVRADDAVSADGQLRRSYAQLIAARTEQARRRAEEDRAQRNARIAQRQAASPAVPPAREEPARPELPSTGDQNSLLLAVADESARFARWAELANVGTFTLDEVNGELRDLAHDYLSSPPLPVFERTRTVRDLVFDLLAGHQYPAQTRELYLFAGYSCTLLAWISGDLGQMRAADTHARTAWLCAQLADSPELRAWVLATRSKTAFWIGNYQDAVNLARRGGEQAPATTARVFLAAQQADALSMTGAKDDAQDAVNAALAARDRITGPDSVGGILSCGPARLANYASAVHLRLGDTNQSLQATSAALDAYAQGDERAYGTEAQIHITRSQAFLARRDLDAAAEALRPVLDLAPDRRLDTLGRRLRLVQQALSGSDVRGRAAAALRDRIETFRRVTAASMSTASYQLPGRKESHQPWPTSTSRRSTGCETTGTGGQGGGSDAASTPGI